MKKITVEWKDPTEVQSVYKCESAIYGADSRNAVLRGVDFPTRQPGAAKTAAMLIPLDGVRAFIEEEW